MTIDGDQFVALVALSFMLLLLLRGKARQVQGTGRQRFGIALIWVMIFVLVAMLAAAFGR